MDDGVIIVLDDDDRGDGKAESGAAGKRRGLPPAGAMGTRSRTSAMTRPETDELRAKRMKKRASGGWGSEA
jgi:hypothetical protein